VSFHPFRTHVHSVERLSPHFLRITFAGPHLAGFVPPSPLLDLRVKLILPGPDGRLPTLSSADDWYAEWASLPPAERGRMRTYSVRDFRAAGPDSLLTVDFVLHLAEGATGPASRWAANARPGDPVLVVGPGPGALPGAGIEFTPGGASDLRLIGDETAAPAIARILQDLPHDSCGEALIEVPGAADQLDVAAPPGMTVTWLPREGAPHGSRLLEPLALSPDERRDDAELVWETPAYSASGESLGSGETDGDGTYYWIAGESGVVTALRRHLVKNRGVPRTHVAFMGYWKRGVAMGG
jgi:NADPH-dependent ferric siderophore reductase